MSRLAFPPKSPSETYEARFPFISRLSVGETISSPTVSASVYSGVDASPSALISGAASISGTEVKQKITGGLAGVTYLLVCTVSTSLGQSLTMSSYLAILPASAL